MSDKETGPRAGLEGVVEDVKGKVKEVAGRVSGNEEREREGQAQQDKTAAQRDVALKEAQAEQARRGEGARVGGALASAMSSGSDRMWHCRRRRKRTSAIVPHPRCRARREVRDHGGRRSQWLGRR